MRDQGMRRYLFCFSTKMPDVIVSSWPSMDIKSFLKYYIVCCGQMAIREKSDMRHVPTGVSWLNGLLVFVLSFVASFLAWRVPGSGLGLA